MKIIDEKTGKFKDVRLPKAFKNKWIKALRSGKYKQSKSQLQDSDGYCCLGVACRIAHPKKKFGSSGYIDSKLGRLRDIKVPEILKGDSIVSNKLASMNDSGCSFIEIADFIEKEL